MMINRIVRKNEACKILGVCAETLRLWVKKGYFPKSVKIGIRAVGWLESDINDFLIRRSADNSQKAA